MSNAKFTPPSKSAAGGRFFGFDDTNRQKPYQMVPVGEVRMIGVETLNQKCQLRVLHTSVLGLAGELERIMLEPNKRYEFPLHGKASGRTQLIIEDSGNRDLASLTVSVKTKQIRSFSLFILRDTKRQATRHVAHALAIMAGVRKTFLQQANLQLELVTVPEVVSVKLDLGDPIDVVAHGTLSAILDATPASAFGKENIRIYCTWEIKDSSRRNDTVGFADLIGGVYVEDDGDAYTFGHEVGHALGLTHGDNKHTLMYKKEKGGVRSPRLLSPEIDAINPSGA